MQRIKPFKEVAVVNGYANADAVSIGAIAAAKGIPIIVVDRDTIPSAVSSFLTSAGIEKSYVIGGTAVVSDTVKSLLPNAERISGMDRYDTNREVLKRFEDVIAGGPLFFANGNDANLVDSLTGAPMAAKLGGAVVLSNIDNVPSLTKAFINTDLDIKSPGILGGTAVMSDLAVNALRYLAPTSATVQNGSIGMNKADSTFEDVTVNGSVLLGEEGQMLKDATVNGTVFVDPGADGSATLENVKATRIVVLSGASSSVHMKNTKAENLVVSSSSPDTNVVAETGTTIGSTLVQSNGTIESQSGANVGVLTAQPRIDTPIAVGLQGTFSNDVALSGSVKLTAEAGAVVSNVKVAKAASPEAIQFAGQFPSVSVTDSSPITIVSGTVAKMVTATSSSIVVKQGASSN